LSNVAGSLYSNGYRFVCRYYCSNGSSKLLSTSESAKLTSSGLKRVVVFENSNNEYSYFSKSQGSLDANKAVSLARARGQNTGTVIYFAVDYDASESEIKGNIMQYFAGVYSVLNSAGYYVGVYGSGLTCSIIKASSYCNYSWLSMSTGWRGYSSYTDWNIKQLKETTFSGIDIDTDQANTLSGIGAW